ncbi:MAG: heavy-metal-associated domain-containing protein [Vicingaceae bacterium]|nr:heavy-metal-associated domain-containing protein [Vicingaceae bacterium]
MKQQVVIQNLKCGGCAHTIKTELSKLIGISNVIVNEEVSIVEFDNSNEDSSPVITRLDELGYPIEDNPNNMLKKAKSYVSCAVGRITKD